MGGCLTANGFSASKLDILELFLIVKQASTDSFKITEF